MAGEWFKPRWNPEPQARQAYVLSELQLDQASLFHCSQDEIAHALGMSHAAFKIMLNREHSGQEMRKRIALGQSKGKRALRSVQFRVALSGNTNMLIWLGRCILKQLPHDEVHMHVNGDATDAELSQAAKEHLVELARHLNTAAIAAQNREVECETMPERGCGNGNGHNGNIVSMS